MAGLTFNVFGHDVSASKTIRNVEGQAGKSSKNIGGSFKKMGGLIAGGFAAAGIGDFLKGSFDEATEAQKVGAQTTAVLKSTGGQAGITAGQIGDLATSISNKAGIDDEAIQSGENLLLTFTDIRNEAGAGNDIFNQTTQIMTDMSVATGTDMKGSAIQLGKALNDPIKGVSALSRVGVSFTAQQKKQIKALVESGDKMGAQKIILRELNKEFGGSAAAQVTPAEKAKVAWGNLQEQIGTYLLPIVAKLANFLTQHVIPAMVALVGWIQKNRGWLIPLATAVAAIVAVWKLWAIAQAALNLVMEANPIMLVVAAVAALAVGLYMAWKKSETFRNIVKGVFRVVADAGKFMWNNVLKPAFAALSAAWRVIGAGLRWVWDNIIKRYFSLIKTEFRIVLSVVKTVAGWVSVAFRGLAAGLRWAWDNIIQPVFGAIKTGIRAVRDVIRPVGHAISVIFSGIGSGLRWAYDHVISPIFGAIQATITTIIDGINYIKSYGGLHGHVDGGPSFPSSIPSGGSSSSGRNRSNAQGTGYFAGGWTRINELGQESVMLPRGSRIRTHAETMSAGRMGGGDINITVPIHGVMDKHGAAVEVRQALLGLKRTLRSDLGLA